MKAETADQSIVNTQRVKMQAAFDNIVEEGRGKHKLEGNDLNVFVASKAANVFERAYDNSAGYADKHQGTNSPLEPLAAVPQPEKKEDIAPGMSSHYGPGATFDQMKKPNLDPAYKAATDSALHDVKTMRNSVQATDDQQSQLKPSVVAELPESLANPGEQSQQLEQRGNLQPEALASTDRPGEQPQEIEQRGNLQPEALASTGRPGEQSQQLEQRGNLQPEALASTDRPGEQPQEIEQRGNLQPEALASTGRPGEQSQQLEQRGNLQPEALASTGRPGEQSQQLEQRGNLQPEALASTDRPGEQPQEIEQRGNLQPEALASTGRPGEQSQQPDTLANKKNEDADNSATNSNAKVDHVSSLIGSGKFNEDTRPALEENLAHAQNSLEQVAQERGLDNHWVNANLRRYTEAVQTAPRGNENQAAIDELSSAGVTTNNGSMPPIPQGKNNPQGGVMPPVEYQKYKDGVDGF
ncbi:hypothetical protein I6L35_20930 (plasmid) [Aeromonas sp. FDAARGOS 1405]|uniref:hypothetical protein n=2 Tax=unclassified Aeromonas TaxID=257493 RepID=UPI001C2453C9|nr:hypothetical protein [Aeromonas sp. FDAARGOS 1405]QXB31753.1 hypothetical protein I6L35_20930 [Aeromonas sp. FDAARGOS 1405]